MTTTDVNKKFDAFASKYLARKRVDTDGYPRGRVYQCVDLIKQYMHEEFGIPYGSYGDAVDYWHYTAPIILTKFTKVATTSVKKGDIVVLKPVDNLQRHKAGHITLASGKQTSFTYQALEQNGYDGSGNGLDGNAIRYRNISKSRILGVLRPKVTAPKPAPKPTGKRLYFSPIGQTATFFRIGGGTFSMKIKNASYNWRVLENLGNKVRVSSASAGGDCWVYLKYSATGKTIPGRYIK